MSRLLGVPIVAAFFWALFGAAPATAALTPDQPRLPVLATVIANAPIYIGPKVTPVPLRTAAVGTRLEVLAEEGEWVQVRFGDPVFGPRVGWVRAALVRIERQELRPLDLSLPPDAPPVVPGPAGRQGQAPREPLPTATGGMERSGFLIGVSAGLGFLGCADCDWQPGLGLDFHVGGMVGERVGLMYDNTAVVVSVDDAIVTLDTMTVAVQHFTGSRGWVKAGAGFALVTCTDCFAVPIGEAGFGLMFGAGGEVLQRGRFAMDVQGRFTVNFFEDARLYTTMATVGFNWY